MIYLIFLMANDVTFSKSLCGLTSWKYNQNYCKGVSKNIILLFVRRAHIVKGIWEGWIIGIAEKRKGSLKEGQAELFTKKEVNYVERLIWQQRDTKLANISSLFALSVIFTHTNSKNQQ